MARSLLITLLVALTLTACSRGPSGLYQKRLLDEVKETMDK